ncbi:energy transducer TonB family protein [Polynucleobacter rarus]|uniref:energy transducer TonB family protein n=1 Tax=Polynucleobacter rarus TaxID=556055 RepID=UPI000D3E5731|nr:energy transducer TonB [Polynucleobacter rarus]
MQANLFQWFKRSIVIAVLVSIVIHVVFIVWQQENREVQEVRLKTPLAVVLVNSQSKLAPLKPKKLAQNDLNGGGQSDQLISATTIAAINPGIAKELEDLQKEQNRLISSMNNQGAMTQKNRTGQSTEELDKLERLEAELANRLQQEASKPRKAILTSTSAKAVIYAQYYDAMRKKVEKYGTTYFPRNSNGPLYGSLIVLISVDKSGKIISKPKIEKSSGNLELDQQAIAIVNACAPFGKFSPAMMAKLDVIDWIATFDFIQGVGQQKGQSQLELGSIQEIDKSGQKSNSANKEPVKKK